MGTGSGKALNEEEFRQALEGMVREQPAKIYLAKSNGVRIDMMFAVGDNQAKPIKLLSHKDGFYVLGEGVENGMVVRVTELLHRYCSDHKAVPFPVSGQPHVRQSPSRRIRRGESGSLSSNGTFHK